MKKIYFITALLIMATIAYGQPKKGGVIGIYALTVTLDPDVTMNQYLDYALNEFIPVFEKNVPGVKIFYLHGYRGDHSNGYGLMIYCESVEVYDKYWNEKGENTEMLNQIYEEHLKEHWEKAGNLAKLSWDFTDWKIL